MFYPSLYFLSDHPLMPLLSFYLFCCRSSFLWNPFRFYQTFRFSGIFFIYSGIGGEFFFFILFFRFIFSVFSGRSTFSTNRFQVCQRTFSVISFTRKCRFTFISTIPRSLYNRAGVSTACRYFSFLYPEFGSPEDC